MTDTERVPSCEPFTHDEVLRELATGKSLTEISRIDPGWPRDTESGTGRQS